MFQGHQHRLVEGILDGKTMARKIHPKTKNADAFLRTRL
jgi:hypothetical protein